MSLIRTWTLSLLRPKVTRVQVRLFENGKPIDNFYNYPESRIVPLLKCLHELWEAPRGSQYWFEPEIYEMRPHCLSKRKPISTLHVTCYRESLNSKDFRTKAPIPGRYMKRMFDKRHRIYPEQIGYIPWPEVVEVKFLLVE